MSILNRFFSSKKKQSLADSPDFTRLQTDEMDTVLGGRPAGPTVPSLDIDFTKTSAQTTQSNYVSSENDH